MDILRVLASALLGITVSGVVTFGAGPATQTNSTLIANPNTVVADGASTATLSFVARDMYNNVAPNTSVTLSSSGGNNTFNPASGATDANGLFTATLRSTLAQNKTVTISFAAGNTVSKSVIFVPGTASASTSSFGLNPNTQIANNTNTIVATLTLLDAAGNPISGVTPVFTAAGSSTTISAVSATSAAGQSQVTYRSPLAQNENAVVTAQGLTLSQPLAFVAGPPTSDASSLTASPNILAGDNATSSTLTLTARDAQGNAAGNVAVTLSGSAGNITFGSASGTTSAAGIYTTTIKSAQMQNQTITATLSGSVTETTFIVFTGPASATTSVFSVSPTSATAGPSGPITASITLKDSASNPLSGVAPTWSASGTSTGIAPSGNTSSAGVATAVYTSTLAQNENILLAVGGLSYQTAISYVPGPPSASMSTIYAKPTRQLANNSNTILVYSLIRDAYGNPLSNQAVSFTASGTATTISGGMALSALGAAQATYRTSTIQNQNAQIQVAGVTLLQPIIFTGTPASCSLSISPTSQPATGKAAMTMTATVLNSGGTAVPNVNVTFSSAGGATNFAPGSSVTSAAGVATTSIASAIGGTNKFFAHAAGIQCTAQGNFTFGSSYCSGTPTYNYMQYGVGGAPYGVSLSDLNKDGVLDLIVTSLSATNGGSANGTLSVLLGNTGGTFQTPATYPIGAYAWQPAVADINADGNPDVLVPNLNSNNVSVFFGTANGTLVAQPSINVMSPIALALVDLDFDGALDLIVSNRYNASISILLGTNTGQFLPALTYASNSGPNDSVAVGDLNGDGLYDIVVGNVGNSTLSLLYGTSPANFAAPTTLSTSSASVSGAYISDLNGDGLQDIIANLLNDAAINLWLNNGGAMPFSARTGGAASGGSYFIRIDDLNGDGIPDLFAPDDNNNVVETLFGTGSGTFASYKYIGGPNAPYGATSADVNADGKTDLVFVEAGNGRVSVLLYTGCN